MLRAKNIWVAGGDPRQAALAALLADDGHSVHTYALEQGQGMTCEESMEGADRADCVVLPLPAAGTDGKLNAPLSEERHDLAEILDALRPGQLVCAGMAGEKLKNMAAERELVLRDYFAREELAVLNAVAPALAVGHRTKPVWAYGSYRLSVSEVRDRQMASILRPQGYSPLQR